MFGLFSKLDSCLLLVWRTPRKRELLSFTSKRRNPQIRISLGIPFQQHQEKRAHEQNAHPLQSYWAITAKQPGPGFQAKACQASRGEDHVSCVISMFPENHKRPELCKVICLRIEKDQPSPSVLGIRKAFSMGRDPYREGRIHLSSLCSSKRWRSLQESWKPILVVKLKDKPNTQHSLAQRSPEIKGDHLLGS